MGMMTTEIANSNPHEKSGIENWKNPTGSYYLKNIKLFPTIDIAAIIGTTFRPRIFRIEHPMFLVPNTLKKVLIAPK
jgi:hypothetical protein